MDDFYAARSSTSPPLPWPNFAAPFSTGLIHEHRTHLDVQRSVLRNLPIFEALTGSEARERLDGGARKKKVFFWSRKKKRL